MRLLTIVLLLKISTSLLITGSELIIKKFTKYNINTIFGYTGGSNLHFFDKLYQNQNINVIVNRNEQCSGYAAEGYAKSSNKLGVVITTSGPGLTNIITPLQDATSDGVALLAISGQVHKNKLKTSAFQECDATAITNTCVKYNKLIKNIDELDNELEKAINIALSNRKGAVHLDICSNVFSDTIDYDEINVCDKKYNIEFSEKYHSVGDYEIYNNIKRAFLKSEKPVIIVGQGCNKYYEEIRTLCKTHNIPVCTTLHGLGIIDEYEHNSLGMVGMHGNYAANMAIQNADFILGIGYRFDDRTIGNPYLYGINAKNKKGIAHVDISEEKINEVKNIINPTYSLKMDVGKFINKLNNIDINSHDKNKWFDKINVWKKHFQFKSNPDMTIQHISEKLNYKLNKKQSNYLITTGVGVHQMQVAQYFTWTVPNSLITSGSQGTMGVGVPFAMGAKLANENKIVICIDGDGSFMMTCQDLQTLSENNINVKILIMDNESLQMVQNWQNEFYDSRLSSSKLINPDFVKLANSMGIKARKCSNLNQLDETIDEIINSNYPLLVHFKVKQTKCLPFVPPNNALDEMILS